MSDLLDRAVAQVRALPPDAQDEAARLLLDWAGDIGRPVDDRPPEPIDPAHRAAVAEGLADIRAGRIASEAEIEAAFGLFRRAP